MKKYKITRSFTFQGKRYYVRADTEKEAVKKMIRKQMELEQGLITYDSSMLVKRWTDEVIATYKSGLSDKALSDLKCRVNKHIIPELGNVPIGKIKPVQCQKLINSKAGYSKEYINKISQDLKFIFEKAKENKMIRENPATNIVKPKGHVTHRRSITANERKHFLAVCDADPRFLPFLFMIYCGCRPEEALMIRHGDIIDKGGIPFLHIRGTKTENSDRYVPITPDLYKVIPQGAKHSYISLNRHGKPHTESSYKALVRALYRQMNLSMGCRIYRNQLIPPYPLADDFVPYCLRHTFCTDLQKAGVDVRTAQKLMGHADISTTANIYTHQDDDTLMAAAEKMGCSNSKGATVGATV